MKGIACSEKLPADEVARQTVAYRDALVIAIEANAKVPRMELNVEPLPVEPVIGRGKQPLGINIEVGKPVSLPGARHVSQIGNSTQGCCSEPRVSAAGRARSIVTD
jgi:hypothetical protein